MDNPPRDTTRRGADFAIPEAVLPTHLRRLLVEHVDQTARYQLGLGSSSVVWRAQWRGTPVAVKCPHGALDVRHVVGEQSDHYKKFLDEVSKLHQLKHPNVCQLIGIARNPENNSLGMVMELLDCSLYRRYQSEPRLTIKEHLIVARRVAAGLCYLHDSPWRLVHRDLTTKNIMFTDRRGLHVKICDVGVSKEMFQGARDQTMTLCPGSQGYMAPEALKADEVQEEGSLRSRRLHSRAMYGLSIDIFAFGACLLAMIVRREPEFLEIVRHGRGRDLQALQESNHPLLALIRSCLSEESGARPMAYNICLLLDTLEADVTAVQTPPSPRSNPSSPGNNSDLQHQLRAAWANNASLMHSLETEKQAARDLKRERFEMEEKSRQSVDELQRAREFLREVSAEKEELTESTTSLGRDLQEERSKKQDMERRLQENEEELKQIRESMSRLMGEKARLSDRVASLQEQLEERQALDRRSLPARLPSPRHAAQDLPSPSGRDSSFQLAEISSNFMCTQLRHGGSAAAAARHTEDSDPKWAPVGMLPDYTWRCGCASLIDNEVICYLDAKGQHKGHPKDQHTGPRVEKTRLSSLVDWNQVALEATDSKCGVYFFSHNSKLHYVSSNVLESGVQTPVIRRYSHGQWQFVSQLRIAREGHGCLLVGDSLIVAGGLFNDGKPVYDVESYCFTTGKVTLLAKLDWPAHFPCMVSYKSELLLFGCGSPRPDCLRPGSVASLRIGSPGAAWHYSKYPEVPFGRCGVANVAGCILIAGGVQHLGDGTFAAVPDVFYLHTSPNGKMRWSPLPKLCCPVRLPSLLYNEKDNAVLAMAGEEHNDRSWKSSVAIELFTIR